jgi:hypothetical protein
MMSELQPVGASTASPATGITTGAPGSKPACLCGCSGVNLPWNVPAQSRATSAFTKKIGDGVHALMQMADQVSKNSRQLYTLGSLV